MLHIRCNVATISDLLTLNIKLVDMLFLFMIALWNRADHYIFALRFLLSFFGCIVCDVKAMFIGLLSCRFGDFVYSVDANDRSKAIFVYKYMLLTAL